MIELTSVLIIILFLVFPLPALATSLGLLTTWNLYKKYESFSYQPKDGKRLLIVSMALFLINIICSIFLWIALAFGVYYFIYDDLYLLAFNFLFCSVVSLRWFDFTYHIYRLFIFKLKPPNTLTQSYFVICQGLRQGDGFGLVPVYTDAGALSLGKNIATFKGVFCEEIFSSSNITNVEKKSSEKIKIFTKHSDIKKADIFLITLKDQFYPFKSRQDRDTICKRLSFGVKALPTSERYP